MMVLSVAHSSLLNTYALVIRRLSVLGIYICLMESESKHRLNGGTFKFLIPHD